MKLKRELFEQLRDALLDAFHRPARLQSMVRATFNVNLEEIVTQKGNYFEHVEDLLRWAEERDSVEVLVKGAREANETNGMLKTVEEMLLSAGEDAYILAGSDVDDKVSSDRRKRDEQYEIALSWAARGRPSMRGFDLSGRDLARVKLSPRADLRKVILCGADLSEADLREVDLTGADLRETDLSGTRLDRADLSEAKFSKAEMTRTNFGCADLSGADLRMSRHANINLRGAKYTDDTEWPEDIIPEFECAILVDEYGEPMDLFFPAESPEPVSEELRYEQYKIAQNWDSKNPVPMREFDLADRDLSELDLTQVDMRNANLRGAFLEGTKLEGADLSGVNLSGADLSGAILTEAKFGTARLLCANLCRADLRRSNLDEATLQGAMYTADTKWPDYISPEDECAILVQD